ncbi:MAG TPA: hypothetical protein VMV50_03380 [Candidatus Paceibacterota bacterium]|nr:hypothetical protein [Candidatus Paceibacterota bacterium]
MNNKTIGWVLVAAAALLIVAWFAASSSQPASAPGTTATSTVPTTSPSATQTPSAPRATGSGATTVQKAPGAQPPKLAGVSSLNYLIGLKQNLQCSVYTVGTTPYRTGAVYIANGELRADFTTTVSGQTLKSSMINDGTYLYVWMEAGTYGTKVLAASSVSGSVMASHGGVDPTTNVNFACNSWTPETSVFMPPSNITFQS